MVGTPGSGARRGDGGSRQSTSRRRPGQRAAPRRRRAERIEWIEADLATWAPPTGQYDLVICLYVHVAGPVGELVRRLAAGVAPGGTLLLVGHRRRPATGAPTPAAGQVQIPVEEAVAALHPPCWEILIAVAVIAEHRDRPLLNHGTVGDAGDDQRCWTGRF